MVSKLDIDVARFQLAIREYAKATRKGMAESSARGLRNWMIKCAQETKPEASTSAAIEALQYRDWWWKYVARALANSRTARQGQRGYQAMWSESHGGKGVNARTRKAHERRVASMRRMSRKLIARYMRAIGYIKFFFVYAATLIENETGVRRGKGAPKTRRKFTGFRGYCKSTKGITESAGEIATDLVVAYDFKRRGSHSARSAEQNQLWPVMRRALPEAVKDIQEYAQRKMREAAQRHSAKAA